MLSASELTSMRADYGLLMGDTATISHLPKPTSSGYGELLVNGALAQDDTAACSITPLREGSRMRLQAEGVFGDRLRGKRAWRVILPYGTTIDRTCKLDVATAAGGSFASMEILEVREKKSRALYVECICVEVAPAPAY